MLTLTRYDTKMKVNGIKKGRKNGLIEFLILRISTGCF